MEIIFDPTKDKINIAKHGLSLADAVKLVWDEAQVKIDDSQCYCVVFTDRGKTRRIISLRKATKQEVKYYVEQA